MMTLYRSLVRPHLENCCQIWSPVRAGLVRRLESVQRSFTARIARIGHLNYWQRLAHLGLYSLERRRERYQVIYIYRIIKGEVPNFTCERFRISTLFSARRGRYCVIPPLSTNSSSKLKTIVDHSFAVRAAKLFNVLPKIIRSSESSTSSFKASLDSFLSSVRDQPLTPGYHQPAASNSLLDQVAHMRLEGLLPWE